jgi:hypothetical protein
MTESAIRTSSVSCCSRNAAAGFRHEPRPGPCTRSRTTAAQRAHQGAIIIANGRPVLPRHPKRCWTFKLPPPRRARRRHRRERHPGRQARPAQARPGCRRRHLRLPTRHLPRHRKQDPLPAPPQMNETQPRPARDQHSTRTPARSAQQPSMSDQIATKTPAETRLLRTAMAALLHPAQQRRAGQLRGNRIPS